MHEYATNLTDRAKVVGWLMLVSVAIFLLLGLAVRALGVQPPFWVSPPSAFGVFAAVFAGYDRRLWKARVRGVRLSALPDLNGCWEGHIQIEAGPSRPEEPSRRLACLIRVTQTWSRISVDFETVLTSSTSSMACLDDPHDAFGGLRYGYLVEPRPGMDLEDMAMHVGEARFRPGDDAWSCLIGTWYNGPGFPRHGTCVVERLDRVKSTASWLREQQAS